MKLEVGMYVRTLNGIVKIDKIQDNVMKDTKGYLHYGDFVKASYNIIDILKVGDYVNGFRVEYVYNPTGNKVLWIKLSCNPIDYYENEDIKAVITHEQMERMAYKVGE